LEYQKNNPEKYREIARMSVTRRIARLHNVVHAFTVNEWISKKNATNGICPLCNILVGIDKLTLDHVFPISKAEEGRVYTINDVEPLCLSCNCSKNAKIL
jgi:5-methylcytosine-specific restriction endonuclease McrA